MTDVLLIMSIVLSVVLFTIALYTFIKKAFNVDLLTQIATLVAIVFSSGES